MRTSCLAFVTVCLLAVLSFDAGAADPKLRETARRVLKKHESAVVTVQITSVLAADLPGEAQNVHTVEVTGTLLSAEGLTIISLMARQSFAPEGKIKGAKLIMGDGREIAARLIGRDDHHDLAFLMPTEKVKNLSYLTLPKKVQLNLLDDTLLVYRMSEKPRRPAVVICHVCAEADDKGSPAAVDLGQIGFGGPIFDSSGEPVGIVTASSLDPFSTNEALIRGGDVIEAALKKVRAK